MKYGKDEIQKMILGGLLLIGLIYSYFSLLLGPLEKRQVATRKLIADMEPAIAGAKSQIKTTEGLELAAPQAKAVVAQISAMIPEGSPVAWVPPRIADFFKRQGVDKAATRMNNEFEDKELPGFRRISWGVDLPKVDFLSFASAVAQLENSEPLFQIASLQVDTSRDEAENQHVILTVQNIVK